MATDSLAPTFTCGSGQLEATLSEQDSERVRKRQEAKAAIVKRGGIDMQTLYTIPVVFHVVYHTPDENIALSKILGQLQLLNDCFGNRVERQDVPWVFEQRAADAKIEFKLAVRDPFGRPTLGVTRTYTDKTIFTLEDDDVKKYDTGGYEGWPGNQYFNIWVCNVKSKSDSALEHLFGYTPYPTPAPIAPKNDGVVLHYGTVSGAHDKNYWDLTYGAAFGARSKTLVHETGHYFDLKHLWGDNDSGHEGSGCGDDEVEDTPPQKGPNDYVLFPPRYPHISCNNRPDGDMFMNYMDYSGDEVQSMFTRGQVERMRACLQWSPHRQALLASNALTPPAGFGPGEDWTQGAFVRANAAVLPYGNFFADVTGSGQAAALMVNDVGIVKIRPSTGTAFSPALTMADGDLPLFLGEGGRFYFANVTGDKRAAAILVGDDGRVWVRRWNGTQFGPVETWLGDGERLFYAEGTLYFADIDGSGHDHAILVSSADSDDCRVYVRRSTGSGFSAIEDWSPREPVPLGGKATYFADLTGDGRADMILVDERAIRVCPSNGSGFQMPQVWKNRRRDIDTSGDLHFADVIGDGRAHLITLKERSVTVRPSTGTGFGDPEDWTWPLPALTDAPKIAFGRLSGGVAPDAIFVNGDITQIRRLLRTRFGPLEDWSNRDIGSKASQGPFLARVTGGPNDDMVWFASSPPSTAYMMIVQSFDAKTRKDKLDYYIYVGTFGSRGTYITNLTISPKPDLILLNDDSVKVRRFNNEPNNIYAVEEDWTWHDGPLLGSRGTYFAKVLGGGLAAAVVVDEDKVTIRRSTGEGFGPPQVWSGPLFATAPTGFADLFLTGRDAAILIRDNVITVRRSTPNGFAAPEIVPWDGGDLRGSLGTFFADVTGDGRADLIAVSDKTVTVYPNLNAL